MIDFNENTFIAIDANRNEVVCYILFIFDSSETGKTYIVYTDDRGEKDGRGQLFASILSETEEKNGNHLLLPIHTEREWDIIKTILCELKTEE